MEKRILALNHVSSYAYGSHFFNVDLLRSDLADQASNGGQGAQETYVSYRHHWALGRTFGGRPFAAGILQDVAFTAGFEWNSKNTGFAPGKRALVLGPTLQFRMSRGFLDLGLLYYKERNHNAYGTTPAADPKKADFRGTGLLTAAWGLSLALGPVATRFKGFANLQGPKGRDAAGVETRPELLVRMSWVVDMGALAGLRQGVLLAGPGFEYWRNKFGNPDPIPTSDPVVTRPNYPTRTPTLQLELHF